MWGEFRAWHHVGLFHSKINIAKILIYEWIKYKKQPAFFV
ncbi:hypothetical protein HMPREF0476_0883 [Kingella kingae ATCC 23330]|uniref:Uncharacterized protein n=1 Tax=Kingella kingae ATCC 23330 TaxID=887327 RepID=F5S6Q0_KINKI|nr:hypothetical protein HMPREF0476_0883 [Kingella kingae ATCC 23330]